MNVTAMRTLKRFSLKQTQLLTRGVVQIMLMARHYLIPKMSWQKFTKELADLGYPTTTIGYIACFAPGKLGKTAYCNLIAGKEIKTDYNLERAKYFLDAARTKF